MAFSKQKGSSKKTGKCKLSAGIDMSIYAAQQNHDELMKYYFDFESFEIDLSTVEEIDCSGLQLLLVLQQSSVKEGKKLILQQPSMPVIEAMEVANLKQRFNWSSSDQG